MPFSKSSPAQSDLLIHDYENYNQDSRYLEVSAYHGQMSPQGDNDNDISQETNEDKRARRLIRNREAARRLRFIN